MVSDNQSIRLLKKLLKLSGQNIDQETAAKLLISHPSYPSLEAFTEVMEYFGIPNEAFLMDYDSLAHTEMPLLLHLEIQGGVFVLLLSIHKRSLRIYIPESDKIIDIPKEAFLAKWSGVVFRIEKKAKKGTRSTYLKISCPDRRNYMPSSSVYLVHLFVTLLTIMDMCCHHQSGRSPYFFMDHLS